MGYIGYIYKTRWNATVLLEQMKPMETDGTTETIGADFFRGIPQQCKINTLGTHSLIPLIPFYWKYWNPIGSFETPNGILEWYH